MRRGVWTPKALVCPHEVGTIPRINSCVRLCVLHLGIRPSVTSDATNPRKRTQQARPVPLRPPLPFVARGSSQRRRGEQKTTVFVSVFAVSSPHGSAAATLQRAGHLRAGEGFPASRRRRPTAVCVSGGTTYTELQVFSRSNFSCGAAWWPAAGRRRSPLVRASQRAAARVQRPSV